MTGLIALVGSGEYLETMAEVDRRLLSEAPAQPAAVVCLPAAAGQEGPASVRRWMEAGEAHFKQLGARPQALPIVDRRSAEDAGWAQAIEAADLIYFSGGDPLYLYETLAGSRAWAAVEAGMTRGAVLAGCSAGAMILARWVPDVRAQDLSLRPAFGRVPAAVVMPHFDQLENYRPGATALMQSRLPEGEFALGIDEHTALVGRPEGAWEVLGTGGVTVVTRERRVIYAAGQSLRLVAQEGR